jgi:hypothetical protein
MASGRLATCLLLTNRSVNYIDEENSVNEPTLGPSGSSAGWHVSTTMRKRLFGPASVMNARPLVRAFGCIILIWRSRLFTLPTPQ